MNKEKENKKKRSIIGSISALLFGVLVVGILYAFTWKIEIEPEKPEVLVEFDFSGSTKKGGSGAKAQEVEEVQEQPKTDPIKTQTEESPVKKSTTTKSTKKSSTPKTNKKAMADGMFGGNSGGNSSGNDEGDNNGLGNGEFGPGAAGKSGPLSRGYIDKPNPPNPINETGKVAVKVTVNRSGTVTSAEVLRNHRNTTSNSPEHFVAAKKAALKMKYSPSSSAAEFETGIVVIDFIVN